METRPNYGELTIVVPTFGEAANVPELLRLLHEHTPMYTRVIFVDDTPDNSTLAAVNAESPWHVPWLDVEIVHRTGDDRVNGLAGAVTEGILLATSKYVLVMDGDLQHPPCTIPITLREAQQCQADLVVGSRYCPGGSADGLDSPIRHVVSRASTWVAKGLFPRATRGITDPMTGFFLVRREAVNTDKLQAAGFKILLEIMVSHPQLKRRQVPLQFAPRKRGQSKGTISQGITYLRQLSRLRTSTARPST